MSRAEFLYEFYSLAGWFSFLALVAFLFQLKDDMDTYRRRIEKQFQKRFIKWIRKLFIYLLPAVVLAFIVAAIDSAIELIIR